MRVGRLIHRPEAQVVLAMGAQAASAMVFALLSARWLGPADRGVVVLTATAGSLLMLIGSLGTATGIRLRVAQADSASPVGLLRRTRPLVLAHALTAALAGAALFGITGELGRGWVLVGFVPYAVLMLATYLRRELMHGLGLHGAAVTGDLATTATQTLVLVALHLTGRLGLGTAMGTLTLGLLVQLGWQTRRIGTAQRAAGGIGAARDIGGAPALGELVRSSHQAMLTGIGQAFVIRGDRLLLGAMSSAAAVGIYGAAASLTEVLWLLSGGVGQILFRRASVTGAETGGRRRLAVLGATTAGAAVLALASPLLVRGLLGQEYADAVPAIRVLCAASVAMAAYQLDVAQLNGLGRLGAAAATTALGSLVLLALCLVLIPAHGLLGAAWASLVSYLVLALAARHRLRQAAGPRSSVRQP